MKIYLDVIFIINFIYDFLILSSVSVLLKRHAKLGRIIISCFIGGSALITLFVSFSRFELLLFKIVLSLVMVFVCFGKFKFFEALFYFYIITIILGGSQYMITGNYYKVNLITFGIVSPIIIYLYVKSMKEYRLSINKYYDVLLVSKDNTYKLKGYMDTGNRLRDNIFYKPVIFISNNYDIEFKNKFYVPYKVVGNRAILECGSIDNVFIDGKSIDCLISIIDKSTFKDFDCLLNEYIREIIYD